MMDVSFTNHDNVHDDVMNFQPIGNKLMGGRTQKCLVCDAALLFVCLWLKLARGISAIWCAFLVVVGDRKSVV